MFNFNLKLTLCRTCLTTLTENSKFNIFVTPDLVKKLILCSNLPVEVTDEYPENVCRQCYEQILLFYEFQQMCCKSLDDFNELLKSKEAVKEEQYLQVQNVKNEEMSYDTNDPLEQDCNLNQLDGNSCQLTDSLVDSTTELLEKKKRGRPPKKERDGDVEQAKFSKSAADIKQFEDNNQKDDDIVINCATSCKDQLKKEIKSSINLTGEDKTIGVNDVNKLNLEGHIEDKTNIDSETSSSTGPDFSTSQRRLYPCDRCNESFKTACRLEVHKRQHDELPPYTCTLQGCDKTFNRLHFYKKHLNEHKTSDNTDYKCSVEGCQRSYKNKSALNVHKRKFHHEGPELKTHMCEVCGKVFKSSAVLTDHRYTHYDKTQLPYACEEEGCTKRFSNKEKLKIHKMRHAGIKNFVCPYCGMRKTTRNELKIHINYHTLERTWPCRFCPKVCNSAGNLKMHIRNMHERAKDFACRFCERTFAKADTKKYHEMTHTGEKPHECKECGRRFLQPAALRTHKKIHLREKEKFKENKGSKEVGIETEEGGESLVMDDMVAEILNDTGNLKC